MEGLKHILFEKLKAIEALNDEIETALKKNKYSKQTGEGLFTMNSEDRFEKQFNEYADGLKLFLSKTDANWKEQLNKKEKALDDCIDFEAKKAIIIH